MHHPTIQTLTLTAVFSLSGLLAGCATNPVTGRNEMRLVSQSQEIALGQQNYLPMQQMQGGDQNAFPDLTRYVQGVGDRLVQVSDRPQLPYEFTVVNNAIPNAWALPGGKIAVNRGLLVELEDEAELAAVLSHEIVHAAARHGAKNMERGIILQAGLIGLGLAVENHDYRDVILGAGGLSASLVGLKYGREAELEADRYGIRYMARAGYDPLAAVDLQETFVRLSEGQAENWLAGLFASHPPSRERVAKNRRQVADMPPGGERNQAAYEAALAELRQAQPAYARLTEGYQALDQGDTDTALRLAGEAISLEPRESLFYLLAAKAHAGRREYPTALQNLDQAIASNDRYFDHYLQRGLIRRQLGESDLAEKDLNLSARLLPTGQANTALGLLALEAGRSERALNHFAAAAQTDSPAGRQAVVMLTRLDLPQHPARYIGIGAELSRDGYLAMSATNQSVLPIDNLVLAIEVLQPNGSVATRTQVTFDRTIASGQTGVAVTRIGPFASIEHLTRSIRSRIASVDIAE